MGKKASCRQPDESTLWVPVWNFFAHPLCVALAADSKDPSQKETEAINLFLNEPCTVAGETS